MVLTTWKEEVNAIGDREFKLGSRPKRIEGPAGQPGHGLDINALPSPQNDFGRSFHLEIAMRGRVVEQRIEGQDNVFSRGLDIDESIPDIIGAIVGRCHPQEDFLRQVPEPVNNNKTATISRIAQKRLHQRVDGSRLPLAGPTDEMEVGAEGRLGNTHVFVRFMVLTEVDRFHGDAFSTSCSANSP